jgi:MFS family permease
MPSSPRSLRALDWLNFFLAYVQTGVGPFLAVYHAANHWHPQRVGVVLTCGGLAGVLAQTPGSALVDDAHRKRRLIAIGIGILCAAAMTLALKSTLGFVIPAQILLGGVGAILGPAVAAITLVMGPRSASAHPSARLSRARWPSISAIP